jgi:Flp pilus assembly protein protease CpaA
MTNLVRFSVFMIGAIFIGITDIRQGRIPDVVLITLVIALGLVDILAGDVTGVWYGLMGGLWAFGIFFMVYLVKGGLGFGDVKYAGVIGYFLGPERVVPGLLCGIVLGLGAWLWGWKVLNWKRGTKYAFGPWLSAGAVAGMLLPMPGGM